MINAKEATFGRHGDKGGNRGRRAFVGVGSPLMKRHRGNLEVHAREQSNERNPGERIGGRPVSEAFGNDAQFRRAADSVKQRHAIKKQAGGKRAEQEEFHRRFVGSPAAPQEPGQHILAKGHQFQGNEQNDQVGARHHEHHSHGGEKQQGVILPQVRFLNLQVFHGEENDDGRGQDNDHFGDHGKGIEGKTAVESQIGRCAEAEMLKPEDAELQERKTQPDQGQHGVEIFVALIQQEIKQQDRQAEHGEKDLRLDGLIIQRIEEGVPH